MYQIPFLSNTISTGPATGRTPTDQTPPPSAVGGEGGIRTPVGCYAKAVFKTAAIDHSATSPTFAKATVGRPTFVPPGGTTAQQARSIERLARQEGIEPPTNGFGDRYSTN